MLADSLKVRLLGIVHIVYEPFAIAEYQLKGAELCSFIAVINILAGKSKKPVKRPL